MMDYQGVGILRFYCNFLYFCRIGRACKADCVIGGIPIKAGMRVDVPIYAYHRRPEIWPEPDKFDPER